MTSLNEAFGIAVRRRRQALGFSQEELADRAELHRTYVSLIERGLRTSSIHTVMKLAEALDTTGSQLLRDTEGEVSGHLPIDPKGKITTTERRR